jgi:hypothetical protein
MVAFFLAFAKIHDPMHGRSHYSPTLLSMHPLPTLSKTPSTDRVALERSDRICLYVYRDNSSRYVYIETDNSGNTTFWDEEPGDVQRYPYTPSMTEREALLDAVQAGRSTGQLPAYIDLNVPPGSLDGLDGVNLAAFRTFVRNRGHRAEAVALDREILTFLCTQSGASTKGSVRETLLSLNERRACPGIAARQEAA